MTLRLPEIHSPTSTPRADSTWVDPVAPEQIIVLRRIATLLTLGAAHTKAIETPPIRQKSPNRAPESA